LSSAIVSSSLRPSFLPMIAVRKCVVSSSIGVSPVEITVVNIPV
jgi:hypothetical protein